MNQNYYIRLCFCLCTEVSFKTRPGTCIKKVNEVSLDFMKHLNAWAIAESDSFSRDKWTVSQSVKQWQKALADHGEQLQQLLLRVNPKTISQASCVRGKHLTC